MMKRIIVVCEGETEQEFCRTVLAAYFGNEIYIQYPKIKKSMGGIVGWDAIKKQIEIHLSEADGIVTTLIDYYGIQSRHNFPKWSESMKMSDKNKRMDFLENGMYKDIPERLRYKFIPYLQLHEFEALLFSDIRVFYEWFSETEIVQKDELVHTCQEFDNPELINDNKETSPSHRLKRIIQGYHKTLHANLLAEAIGIEKIRQKCPRFNEWIKKIENAST